MTISLPVDALWLALGALDRVAAADCGVLPPPAGEETREEYPALLRAAAARLWLALADAGEWDRREDARVRWPGVPPAGYAGWAAAGFDPGAPDGDASVILEFSADAPSGRVVTLRPVQPAADPER